MGRLGACRDLSANELTSPTLSFLKAMPKLRFLCVVCGRCGGCCWRVMTSLLSPTPTLRAAPATSLRTSLQFRLHQSCLQASSCTLCTLCYLRGLLGRVLLVRQCSHHEVPVCRSVVWLLLSVATSVAIASSARCPFSCVPPSTLSPCTHPPSLSR